MSRRRHPAAPLIPQRRQATTAGRQRLDALALLHASEELHRGGKLEAALRGYRVLMEALGPRHRIGVRAAFMSALCAFQLRLYAEAILLMEAVRAEDEGNADVHYNLGLFYHGAGMPAAAAACYRYALALRPDYAAAENNLGNALRELGDVETANLCFDRLLARNPQDPEARYNLAHVTLLRGHLGRGFQLYEARWECAAWLAEYRRPDVLTRRLAPDAAPCHVFVHQEQGVGDTLQFMRYLPRLIARGHRVTFEAPIELADWLIPGLELPGVTVIRRGTAIPEHDYHLPLVSLAAYCGTETEADIPPVIAPTVRASVPLRTDPGDTRPVIGLCWAGNPKHHNDRHRSTTVAQLAPLLAMPGARFVSLQIGARGADLFAELPALTLGAGSEVIDCSAALTSFEATAALVQRCAAVVTVDTSIAHLAGTLGVRTLILTSWLSEWRWQLERTDSPWYASVELVRQPTLGDWPAAAARARELLEATP